MDDKRFEQWTEILGELREARLEDIQKKLQDKSLNFNPEILFKTYSNQLGNLLSRWWELEKESWEESPPADIRLGIETLKNELDSLIEFELEKIKEEIDEVKEAESSWKPNNIEPAQKNFEKVTNDFIANYSLKIDSLGGKSRRETVSAGTGKTRASGKPTKGSGGTGGFWLLFMFLIGIAIGAAPTVYYWDLNRRMEEKLNQEMSQVTEDRKNLIEKLSVLKEAYRDLAYGKKKNIPELENTIQPIRRSYAEKREQLEKDYIRKQADLIKKIPAGDRLDKSLQNLKEIQDRQRAGLEAEEQSQIEPLLRELKKHKTILEESE